MKFLAQLAMAATLSLLLGMSALAQDPQSGGSQSGQSGQSGQTDQSGQTGTTRTREQNTQNPTDQSGQHTQHQSTSGQQSGQSPTSNTGTTSHTGTMGGAANNQMTTRVSGTIRDVDRHDTTSMFEVSIKDQNGKKHKIYVSPSAIIMQGDQKVANTTLQKGTMIEVEAYTTPSGTMTAKTISIMTTASNVQQ